MQASSVLVDIHEAETEQKWKRQEAEAEQKWKRQEKREDSPHESEPDVSAFFIPLRPW